MRGGHHLKSWSCTQKKVTLSTAEAELAACIKASAETIGIVQMSEGFGDKVEAEVFVDSSAALAVVGRKGNGKLRHIRVGQLWIQQVAEDEVLAYRKVHGKSNPADCCTKNVNQLILDTTLKQIEMDIREGRAQESLEVNGLGELSVAARPRQAGILETGKHRINWADEYEANLEKEEET